MIERQLPAYGIRAQIDPWTRTNFHVLIVSNLEAETTERDEIIHVTLLEPWARLLMNAPHADH
jgi:hypothetical protein